MSKTITKDELIKTLNKEKEDVPVYIYSSFNRWQIGKITMYEGSIYIHTGDTDNPEEEYK